MRTTIDLDPQVLFALKEQAKREKTTIGKLVDQLFRKTQPNEEPKYRNGVLLFPDRKPGSVVTPDHVRELMEEDD